MCTENKNTANIGPCGTQLEMFEKVEYLSAIFTLCCRLTRYEAKSSKTFHQIQNERAFEEQYENQSYQKL